MLTLCVDYIYTVSKKTVTTYLLLYILIKYKSISVKISWHVLEETTNKTVQKVPTLPIMCASTTLGNLNWQIELSNGFPKLGAQNPY